MLSKRVQSIKTSPTLAVSARANQLKAQGHDIINLGVGEPDFDTPEFIKQAAIQALDDGFTKYTAVEGTLSLRQAVIQKFLVENQLSYPLDQVMVSCGVKQGLFNLMQAVLNPGDEVIIPAPYWVSYPDMVLLAEAKPVIIPTYFVQQFKITPEQLEAFITPKTKLVILNSPSNPSGMFYSATELSALSEVLLRYPQILIASDDMYEHILWSQESFANILNVCPELYDRTIVFNGVSKSYAMTGWRIGYAAGPAAIIRAMTNIQSQSTSNPNSIAQVAAEAALKGSQQCVKDMTKIYKQRHDFVYQALRAIPGIQCHPAEGTFYIFPEITALMKPHSDDIAFAEYLLEKVGIAIVPGSAFGAPGCIRLSFATSLEMLEKAMGRFAKISG